MTTMGDMGYWGPRCPCGEYLDGWGNCPDCDAVDSDEYTEEGY